MADNEIAIMVNHIHAYEAITATASTVAEATELGISQSNVSRLLHQIELDLEERLFEQDRNRLPVTREGLGQKPE